MKSVVPVGYKQTEVGVIPEDWAVKQIQEVCGFIVPGRNKPRIFDGTIPWITTPDLDDGRAVFESRSQLRITANEAKSVGSKIVPKGSVVMSCVGELGIVALAGCNIVLNQQLHAFLPSATINGRFLAHAIKTQNEYIYSVATKTALPYLNKDNCNSIPIPVPPLAEQEAIADALSDTDALIESLEQLITKKRHLKQGAMQELLTGKKRLPGFSGEWEERTFDDIFNYHSTATNSRSDLTAEGDIYYIHYGDIHTKFHSHLDFSHTKPPMIERQLCKNATLLQNGDWVMSDASEDYDGVGKSIEISGMCSDIKAVAGLHTFLLREKTPTFAPGFKGHLGNLHSLHQEFLRVATGLKVFGVSKTALKTLSLPVSPIPEQSAIANILSEMDAEITTLETKLDKTRQLKQGMMHNLLTGRIRLI